MSWLYLGFFLWLLSVGFDFEFSTPEAQHKGFSDLWRSFGIRFNRLDGVDFGASLGKMTGLFWMAISLLTDIVLNVELGGFAAALVFFIPAWISAAAWKRELISLQ